MNNGLVSLITPFYNSADYLYRLLDSILMQDYPCIEMFAVDDGSTDDTRAVIEAYIPKFREKGYQLQYVYQENAGQAAAINRGLKLVSGEFLAWPDSDDYYTSRSSVSTFVRKLRELDDSYGAVCYVGTFVDEDTQHDLHWKRNYNSKEELFETILLGGDFLAVPINYMVKMAAFIDVNPQRDIYTGRQPQNMQMLLPLFHRYKCCTIRESLCNIVVRNNSHSHLVKSYEGQLEDLQGYIDILTNTLRKIGGLSQTEEDRCIHITVERLLNSKLGLALNFGKYKDARHFAREIVTLGGTIDKGKQFKLLLSYCPIVLKTLIYIQQIKYKSK